MFAQLQAFANRILGLFRNNSLESRIDEELQFHLDMQTEENRKRGMDPKTARNEALRAIGGIDQAKEEHRDVRAFRLVADFLQDLRFGFRLLRQKPAFAFIAIMTLALAIGPNTAFFSIIKGVQYRYLPFPDPDRLVQFTTVNPRLSIVMQAASYADFEDYARLNHTLESAAIFHYESVNVAGPEEAERLWAIYTTASIFPTLKRAPAIGRVFTANDCRPGAAPVAVLSHSLWKRMFLKNPGIIGKSLSINHIYYTVIGIMPEDFAFPETRYKLWLPMETKMVQSPRDNRFGEIVARLRPGISHASAQQDISNIVARLSQQYPDTNGGYGIVLEDYRKLGLGNEEKLIIWIVYLAVTMVLLIACANISTLLLAKATSRSQEIAVRTSMGGLRSRILRQLLTENIVIAAFGGMLGILTSFVWLKGLLAIVPPDMPNQDRISIDSMALLYTAGIAFLASLLFGILPALQCTGKKVLNALKEGSRASFGQRHHRLLNGFIVLETSMAVVLLIATGMLIQSYRNEIAINPGFDQKNLLAMKLELPETMYDHNDDVTTFIDTAVDNLKKLLRTRMVAAAQKLPMSGGSFYTDTYSFQSSHSFANNEKPSASGMSVTADYFRTLRIPLLQGRNFSESDSPSHPIAIISANIAKQYFGDTINPLGCMIRFDHAPDKKWMEIVGVAGDVHVWSLKETPLPQIYIPFSQLPTRYASFVIRTPNDPLLYASAAKAVIRSINPEQTAAIQTMEEIIDARTSNTKILSQVISSVTLFALLFAALGIYSIISYSVSERTHEIGIRMAFGARKAAICRMILMRGLAFLGIGLCLGAAGAFACTHFLQMFLFGVAPGDHISYGITGIVLLAAGILAMLIPVRRAMAVDPMTAIRYE